MTKGDLMAELIAERYGPRPSRDAERKAALDISATGGPDTELNVARRRRILCEALDEPAQHHRAA